MLAYSMRKGDFVGRRLAIASFKLTHRMGNGQRQFIIIVVGCNAPENGTREVRMHVMRVKVSKILLIFLILPFCLVHQREDAGALAYDTKKTATD